MLPQGLNDTPEAPSEVKKLPISVLAHRATFVEPFRTHGASTTNPSSGPTHVLSQVHGNPPITEASENTSTQDHMVEGNGVTQPSLLEGRSPFAATYLIDGVHQAEEENAVKSSSSGTGQDLPSVPLSHRRPIQIAYPDTIDVDLPDDFVTGCDIHPKKYEPVRPQNQRVWCEQYVMEPSVGWNPNLLICQERAALRSPTITLRFFLAPPPLLRLPTELRLLVLKHLLISMTPITNPYADRHKDSAEKHPVLVDTRILRTCRQIYIEGWPILYQKNTFRFTEKAALESFLSSDYSHHKESLRHLELQTTVAEHYCHRIRPLQPQLVRHMRVRGPAGWDWPFSPPWHLNHLHTLKLEFKDFHLLPLNPPVRTRHFKPDPETREGRDALLSRRAVMRHIEDNCNIPELQDVIVVGIPESVCLLLFEMNLIMPTLILIMKDNWHHSESAGYLEQRTGGRLERQDDETGWHWGMLQRVVSIRREQIWPSRPYRSEQLEKNLARLMHAMDLGVLMWVRRRNAKRLGDKAVAWREPIPLW